VADATPSLQETTATFIQGGVSIIAASSATGNRPVIARALGCRVSRNGRLVTILIPASDPVLDAVRATGAIAVTFSQPSTHRTIQLKGKDARETELLRTDRALSRRYAAAFVADVCPLGYSEELMRAILSCEPPDLSPVTFSPTARFLQTPGPRAGEPLDS
jgi:hypothetical protein